MSDHRFIIINSGMRKKPTPPEEPPPRLPEPMPVELIVEPEPVPIVEEPEPVQPVPVMVAEPVAIAPPALAEPVSYEPPALAEPVPLPEATPVVNIFGWQVPLCSVWLWRHVIKKAVQFWELLSN